MKNPTHIRKLAAILLLVWSVPIYGLCQGAFYSREIRSRVVAPDGTPIAGAIVMISWNVEHYMSGASLRQVAITEVVTGQDGQFRIPAWGPRVVIDGSIRDDEPTTRIYKRGYIPRVVKNHDEVPSSGAESIIRSRLHDQAIVLQPFRGTAAQYEATFFPLLSSLNTIFNARGGIALCYWRQSPRMLLALQELKFEFDAQGLPNHFSFAENYASSFTEEKCGNARQFFQAYVPDPTP